MKYSGYSIGDNSTLVMSMACSKCGSPVHSFDNFCSKCGNTLDKKKEFIPEDEVLALLQKHTKNFAGDIPPTTDDGHCVKKEDLDKVADNTTSDGKGRFGNLDSTSPSVLFKGDRDGVCVRGRTVDQVDDCPCRKGDVCTGVVCTSYPPQYRICQYRGTGFVLCSDVKEN